MKSTKAKLYGYACGECGNDVWLKDAPEKFIYCPFCGESVKELECARILTIQITADEEYNRGK